MAMQSIAKAMVANWKKIEYKLVTAKNYKKAIEKLTDGKIRR